MPKLRIMILNAGRRAATRLRTILSLQQAAARRPIAVAAVMVAAVGTAVEVAAVNPYPQLEAKARRFFAHGEWASASAIYDLMLEERPEVPTTYGEAIVSNAMRGDTAAQMRLMSVALDHQVPFDSVFSQVKQWSFHLGKSHLYENFLKETRKAYPWMRRTIDGNLLKYFAFRRDGAEMVNYARLMLDGAPQNISFLHTLAWGYMLTGNDAEGVAAYERILEIDSNDFDALVALGNWYANTAAMAAPESAPKAIGYLERAYSCRPTPFIAALLARLKGDVTKK